VVLRSAVVYAVSRVGLTSSRSIFVVALIAAALGCRRGAGDGRDAAAAKPLDVRFAGCAALLVRDGASVCELDESRTVRVALSDRARDISVRGGGTVLVPGAGGAGGSEAPSQVLSLTVPTGATRLELEAKVDGEPGAFSLQLAEPLKLPWLADAKAARAKGDLEAARAIASAHLGGGAVEKALAQSLLARISLTAGRADEAFPLFREAIAAHRASARVSDAVDDSFALAFALHQRSHRYDEARAVLDSVEEDLARYPEGRARAPYYRGILASEVGDHRAASTLLREAGARASALRMSRLERNARAALALEMQTLGRAHDSLAVLRALEADPEVKGCERVEILNDLGWGLLLDAEAAGNNVQDARIPLAAAALVADCSDAYLRSFALANLARVELAAGKAAEARAQLAAARDAVKEPRGTERLAWLDLEARIALREGDAKAALATFATEATLAEAALLLDHEWSAAVGRAEALEALGRHGEAAAAFVAAEKLVDRAMLLVPLGDGRGSFLAERSRSARGAVELLAATKRHDEAVSIARASRSRLVASVERALRIERLAASERAAWEQAVRAFRDARAAFDREAGSDWTLPAADLVRATEARRERERGARAALETAIAAVARTTDEDALPRFVPPGEVDLVVHPTRAGWLTFVVSGDKPTAALPARLPTAPAEDVSSVLGAIGDRLVGKERVHVLAYGAFRNVDVHALLYKGAPLGDAFAIDYPLGLRPRDARRVVSSAAEPPRDAGAPTTQARTVIVGDPSTDLPNARLEAIAVTTTLVDRTRTTLLVGSEATPHAVTGALAGAAVFHYAGHGVFAGAEGFESALRLAGGARLEIGDLLALAPGPKKAVLSGCDAARSAGGAEGIGLAQALVVAGADEVLAPVRPVADELATRVGVALYTADAADGVFRGEPGSLAAAARAALLRVRQEDPSSDWAAFRVLAR